MSDGKNLETHLFICTNQKANGECCAAKGSVELREKIKQACQDPSKNWHGRVRVNASGCLGRCKEGIAAVMYPQTKWFTGLKAEQTETILAELSKVLDSK